MRPIDQMDRDLLALLRHNSRASVTELSAALGVSRITVKTRMAALHEDGIIRRFTVDVSEPTGEEMIHAVSLLEIELAKVNKVHRTLKHLPELTSLYTTNGRWAVVAHSETKHLSAFDQLLNKMGRMDGVVNVETCLLLRRLI